MYVHCIASMGSSPQMEATFASWGHKTVLRHRFEVTFRNQQGSLWPTLHLSSEPQASPCVVWVAQTCCAGPYPVAGENDAACLAESFPTDWAPKLS